MLTQIFNIYYQDLRPLEDAEHNDVHIHQRIISRVDYEILELQFILRKIKWIDMDSDDRSKAAHVFNDERKERFALYQQIEEAKYNPRKKAPTIKLHAGLNEHLKSDEYNYDDL